MTELLWAAWGIWTRYWNRNWKWSRIQLWHPSYFGRDQGYSEKANKRKSLQEQLPHRAVYSAKVHKTKAWTARTKNKEELGSPSPSCSSTACVRANTSQPTPRKTLPIILLSNCRAFKRSSTTRSIFVPFFPSAQHHDAAAAALSTAEEFEVCGSEGWDLKGGDLRGEVGRGEMGRKGERWGGRMFPGSFFHCCPPLSSLYPQSR